jgi:hypothetical protein
MTMAYLVHRACQECGRRYTRRSDEPDVCLHHRRSSRFEDVVKRVEDEAGPEGRAELDAFRRLFARAWRNEGA